ncbi:SRPBCC family protein [Streptomyces ziwulingensis]|uniref:Carbon monoxide dehydrogenase n=1 Tax=Streptomyces ziwulingensis TaxID=1045501 RepID=A0ABP9B566_9ACTN
MELRHEFTVPVPPAVVWRALTDIERVAPCMPGATVEEFDGRTVTGSVRVRMGPVTLTYRGTAVFEERDERAYRMVLVAGGRETRGQSTARATVTGTLTGGDGSTTVSVDTDLTVTGRPAQLGRGMIAEVGDRLVGRFAESLSELLATATEAPRPARAEPARPAETPTDEPLDLFRTAGAPLVRRAGTALAAALAAALVITRVRRWRRRS